MNRLFFGGEQCQSMGDGFQPHGNSNSYVYHTFCLSAMPDTTLGVHIGMMHLFTLAYDKTKTHVCVWERAICASFSIITFSLHKNL